MLISEKIKICVNEFESISDKLYIGDGSGVIEIKNILDDAVALINIFIRIIPSLNQMGLDIPKEIIEGQIHNLEEGLENRDFFLIADTLKYEINDTLMVVNDLVTEGVIKDEELFQ